MIDPLIRDMLEADHARLDKLLARALREDGTVDVEAFSAFRAGLARHIGMEEKILFPAVKRAAGGSIVEGLARLRADHGKLVALLVPSPDAALLREIAAILGPHNAIEEGPRGVYAACEALLGVEVGAVRAALAAAPDVPMRPFYDGPWPSGRRVKPA